MEGCWGHPGSTRPQGEPSLGPFISGTGPSSGISRTTEAMTKIGLVDWTLSFSKASPRACHLLWVSDCEGQKE